MSTVGHLGRVGVEVDAASHHQLQGRFSSRQCGEEQERSYLGAQVERARGVHVTEADALAFQVGCVLYGWVGFKSVDHLSLG